MTIFLLVIFILSSLAILQSYVLYPLHLSLLAGSEEPVQDSSQAELPRVDVIVAAFNEASIIERKMQNLLEIDYPEALLRFYIGSDGSSDQTVEILEAFAKKDSRIRILDFKKRRGKSAVVNDLVRISEEESQAEVLLMTDASVMAPSEILKLAVAKMQASKCSFIDVPIRPQQKGIAKSENDYLSFETWIKDKEARIWQRPMGVYGGFYLLNRASFEPIPQGFAVDDFFLVMQSMEKGGRGDILTEMHCWEPHSGSISDEYRRKRRIATGNFQNLRRFGYLLFRRPWSLSYSFLSHKVLRWLTPVSFLLMMISATVLALMGVFPFVLIVMLCLSAVVFLPLLDFLLSRWGIDQLWMRNLRYFVWMNVALAAGLINYINGIKNSIWDPPSRD